jgi:hypothetical protein
MYLCMTITEFIKIHTKFYNAYWKLMNNWSFNVHYDKTVWRYRASMLTMLARFMWTAYALYHCWNKIWTQSSKFQDFLYCRTQLVQANFISVSSNSVPVVDKAFMLTALPRLTVLPWELQHCWNRVWIWTWAKILYDSVTYKNSAYTASINTARSSSVIIMLTLRETHFYVPWYVCNSDVEFASRQGKRFISSLLCPDRLWAHPAF